MPRVFTVTLTREFDVTILAESENDIDDIMDRYSDEIDDWNPPNWEWNVIDPLAFKTKAVMNTVPKYDMVIIKGELYSAEERGYIREKILALEQDAQRELDERNKDYSNQLKLPFILDPSTLEVVQVTPYNPTRTKPCPKDIPIQDDFSMTQNYFHKDD